MPVKLLMPKIGLNMVEGQINEWLVKEGESVKKDQNIYIVETDKVTNDVTAPQDGILIKILVEAGKVVPVRAVVGVLVGEGEKFDFEAFLSELDQKDKAPVVASRVKSFPDAGKPDQTMGGELLASPLAKRLAMENGIALIEIKGTGPGGRIRTEDVEAAIKQKNQDGKKADPPGRLIPVVGVRKIIADRLSLAASSIPMVTLHTTIQVTNMVTYREKLKQSGMKKELIPSYNAILAFCVARSLKDFPFLNAYWLPAGIYLNDPINIGIAVDTPDGLRVVVLRNAGESHIDTLHDELSAMTGRAIAGKNAPEELSGGTFTITNLGMFGIDGFTPIINPPESGILGVGKILEKDGNFSSVFSLVFDHRVIDGAPAAQFLQRLGEEINAL